MVNVIVFLHMIKFFYDQILLIKAIETIKILKLCDNLIDEVTDIKNVKF